MNSAARLPTFEEFDSAARARGFDAVVVRRWEPNTVVGEHTHPFDADALVVQGEMWLTVGAETQHLLPGDTFQLARERPHAERYGADGATYWVGRRT